MAHLKQHFHNTKRLWNSTDLVKSFDEILLENICALSAVTLWHPPQQSQTIINRKGALQEQEANKLQYIAESDRSLKPHLKLKMRHTGFQINHGQCFPWSFSNVISVYQNGLSDLVKSSSQLLSSRYFCFKAVITRSKLCYTEMMSERGREECLKLPSTEAGYIHTWKVLKVMEDWNI